MNGRLACVLLGLLAALAESTSDLMDADEVPGESSCSFLQTKLQEQPASQAHHFWSGKNGDLLRTGYSPHAVKSSLEGGPDWSFEETESENRIVRASPIIDKDENIILASVAGYVRKFRRDGKLLWKYRARSGIPGTPALEDTVVFIATHQGEVVALGTDAGDELWTVRPGNASGTDTWSLTVGDGIVVTAISMNGFVNDMLVGLDANTGQVKWTFRPDMHVVNLLAGIKDSSLIFSDATGAPYRLDLGTGELIWKTGPAGDQPVERSTNTGGTIIGPNGVIYVTSNANSSTGHKGFGGYVTAFRFSDGEMLWRASADYRANNAAAIGEIVSGRLGLVLGVGLNPAMPTRQAGRTVPDNHPSLDEKKGRVLALDAATGEELWRREMPPWHGWAAGDRLPNHVCLPDSFSNAAIGGDGTAYIGFESGAFFAIRDKDGDGSISESEMSKYDFQNSFQGSPGIAPGMLVATPCNGMHVFLS